MLHHPKTDDAARLRDFFQSAGYTESGLREALGTSIPVPARSPRVPTLLARTAGARPFDLLARCFFLTRPISTEAAQAIPANLLSILRSCGLLIPDGDGWRATALLTPCRGLWLASDTYEQRDSEQGRDHVMTVNQPALTLLDFTIPEPRGQLLDLCSGILLHGLAAGGSCSKVIGSDLNPRARMYGAFNAALNGRENVECVTGDMLSAVEDRAFDLVLSNPPFVLSPGTRFLFRDNSLELDGFCRRLVREVPDHLKEEGFCQLICEWVEIAGQSWQGRLREWFEGTGCDAWVLAANRQLPASYARDWVYETGLYAAGDLQAQYGTWLDYFAERKVEAIHGGLIFLRRRSGDNWVSFGQVGDALTGPVGRAVLQGFSVRDFLQAHRDDSRLLKARLRIAAGTRLEYRARRQSGAWQPESMVLRVADGIPVKVALDANVRALIERLDRFETLGDAIEDFAGQLDLPVKDIQGDCLQMLRRLLEQGCLVPA